MDTGIHNACHLMNIAHCMQLPDLQYELKHTISCTLYSSLPVMCTSCSSFFGGGGVILLYHIFFLKTQV